MDAVVNIIKRSWRGEERLWKIFWLWPILFTIVLVILLMLIFGAAGYFAFFTSTLGKLSLLPFNIWYYVSVWRCAWNAGWKGWGYIARGWIILVALHYVADLIFGYGAVERGVGM